MWILLIPARVPPVSPRCTFKGLVLLPCSSCLLQLTLDSSWGNFLRLLSWCSLSGMKHPAAISTVLHSPEHVPQGGCPPARPHPWAVTLSSDPQTSSSFHQWLPSSPLSLLLPLQNCSFFFIPQSCFLCWKRGGKERMRKGTCWVYLHFPGDLFYLLYWQFTLNLEVKILASLFTHWYVLDNFQTLAQGNWLLLIACNIIDKYTKKTSASIGFCDIPTHVKCFLNV